MTRIAPELDHRIADWLEDDPGRAPGQVTETVLAAIPSIPQRRRGWFRVGGRTQPMSSSMRLAAGIAIVAIVGVGALAFIYRGPDTGRPSVPPTATPTHPRLPAGTLEPGSYRYDGADLSVVLTVPPGWEGGPFNIAKAPARELPDGANVLFRQPTTVFADPCDEGSGEPLGPTVDDLVTTLLDLPNSTAAQTADVTIGGFSGTHVEFVVDTEAIDCLMALYGQDGFVRAAENGQREDLWILDVDGTLLVIDAATYPETSAVDRAELEAIVDTLVIQPTD